MSSVPMSDGAASAAIVLTSLIGMGTAAYYANDLAKVTVCVVCNASLFLSCFSCLVLLKISMEWGMVRTNICEVWPWLFCSIYLFYFHFPSRVEFFFLSPSHRTFLALTVSICVVLKRHFYAWLITLNISFWLGKLTSPFTDYEKITRSFFALPNTIIKQLSSFFVPPTLCAIF